MARGKNARPEETLMMAERDCFRSCGKSAAVRRMGPRRLVATMASASARSDGWASNFSARMMPALLMRTLSEGNSATTLAPKSWMASGCSISSRSDFMPGFAAVVSSSACCRRPATITWLPSAWSDSARPRPMPEPPPVMRMVLPLKFIGFMSPQRHHRPIV